MHDLVTDIARRAGVMALILVMGCGAARGGQDPIDPTPYLETRDEAIDRLVENHLDRGWVVSRYPDGRPERMGEALIWSSKALAHIECERSRPVLAMLSEMAQRLDGDIVRHEPLGEYEGGREINFDGETGFLYGMAMRIRRCPFDGLELEKIWTRRKASLDRREGRLHPNVDERLPLNFDFIRKALDHEFSLRRGAPDLYQLRLLEGQVLVWVGAVKAAKAACYRVHLSHLHIRAAQILGYTPSPLFVARYCGLTSGMQIPLVDHWCGRNDRMKAYLDAFKFDQWEYRHQRCGAWETPDGQGLSTPALDYIVAVDEIELGGLPWSKGN